MFTKGQKVTMMVTLDENLRVGTTVTIRDTGRYGFTIEEKATYQMPFDYAAPQFNPDTPLKEKCKALGVGDIVRLKPDSKIATLNKDIFYRVTAVTKSGVKLNHRARVYAFHNFQLFHRVFCVLEEL